ncbi:A24 family peptidase [Sinanaerobacter sp. ZZT-01]|uniref:A24 family peptidase n=1 Tax=Sinanaerobacter sp. ZZT-01 TaxID=3111540 RepID=UPI002D76E23C|nr:A24 family peptidase [Sinanaerobacter sp. ZZT-01]WRR93363.1 A24 family peptidase [Sinanaerobacter sp. ZZT-01]
MICYLMPIPILAYAAYWDYRCRIIPNKAAALLIAVTFLKIILFNKDDFFISASERILGVLVPAMILFLLYKINQRGLGGGDYKLILSLGLFIGISALSTVLMLACILAILYCFIKKINAVPFAVPIFISYCFYCCSLV